ncbi:hypothetical protein J2X87_003279 [Pseudomonas synxantha]|uniref:Uncharacterized protein n=1 Tax=Pseudomonas synxantha TaxID=47883 RepID=A0ACC6JPS9_9PSED|nr:hypothetical protein [Pseudomonas synxantha]
MSTAFDMELFLAGVLTGAHATRQRHISQAKAIQVAIADRWHRDLAKKTSCLVYQPQNRTVCRINAVLLSIDHKANKPTLRKSVEFSD